MNIYRFDQIEDLYQEVAKKVIDKVNSNPKTILGLATGSTPIGLYQLLIKKFNNNKVSFKDVKVFNLDEYVGLDPSHAQSYAYFMKKNLFDSIDIDQNQTYIPSGIAPDLEKETKRYEVLLDQYPIDIQLLGLGSNGHIGFNEPGTAFHSKTHVIKLDSRTRKDNARFFNSLDEVPHQAITMGIDSIMKAKEIILIAIGDAKADAVKKLIQGKIDSNFPASILQTHSNVHIYIDQKANKEFSSFSPLRKV